VPDLAWGRSLALVLWLGVATVVGYMCFVTGLRRVTAAMLSLAESLVAAVLALAVLGERPPPLAMAGAALLLAGLVLVSLPVEPPVPAPGRGERRYARVQATGAVKVESTTGERP
jgi:DME family drug/metabolite transporter